MNPFKKKVRVDVAMKLIEKAASIHFATFESKILDIQNQYNIVSERLLRIERGLESAGVIKPVDTIMSAPNAAARVKR